MEKKNKTNTIQIRFDDDDLKEIDKICKSEGMTRSEYFRVLKDKDFFSRGLLN